MTCCLTSHHTFETVQAHPRPPSLPNPRSGLVYLSTFWFDRYGQHSSSTANYFWDRIFYCFCRQEDATPHTTRPPPPCQSTNLKTSAVKHAHAHTHIHTRRAHHRQGGSGEEEEEAHRITFMETRMQNKRGQRHHTGIRVDSPPEERPWRRRQGA